MVFPLKINIGDEKMVEKLLPEMVHIRRLRVSLHIYDNFFL